MEFLKLKENVKYRGEAFGGLIFDPERSAVLEINPEGLSIIELLEDGISKEELKSRISTEHYQSMVKFLDILKRLNLLKEETRNEENG